jgi:hypothetical protein
MSYTPKPVPVDPAGFQFWLEGELRAIAEAMSRGETILRLPLSYVNPDKPREGDLRNADGESWDPGSGQGPYIFQDGEWVPLGGAGGGRDRSYAYFVGF